MYKFVVIFSVLFIALTVWWIVTVSYAPMMPNAPETREEIRPSEIKSPEPAVSTFTQTEIKFSCHISSTGLVNILNNSNARDVSYQEVINFLLEDPTDKTPYDDNHFVCADYAQALQQNAEKKGIHCGWVYVDMLEVIDHSLNAFRTTDRGIIFVDDSGVGGGEKHPANMDKIVSLNKGCKYCPVSLIAESGWKNQWQCTGTIVDYRIYW